MAVIESTIRADKVKAAKAAAAAARKGCEYFFVLLLVVHDAHCQLLF
jgi:hypothetical protein